MTTKKVPGTRITSAIDPFDLWTTMMGSGGFGRRSLWMVFLDASARVTPIIVPLDEVPAEPTHESLVSLRAVARGVVESGDAETVAFLLSRPGPGRMEESDRRWAAAIREAFEASLMPWPMHLATTDRIQVFAAEDLLAS